MPHIHSDDFQHDLTTSAYIVRTDFPEPMLLVHMHKKVGKLLQPGGHVELSENPWQAIAHELVEETGYEFSQLKVLQPKDRIKSLSTAALHPIPVCVNTHEYMKGAKHFHTDINYAFVASANPAGMPVEGESHDLRWVTLEELMAFSSDEISQITREIGEFVLTTVLRDWDAIDVSNFALDTVRDYDFVTIGCPRKKGVNGTHPDFITGIAKDVDGVRDYGWHAA
jgi:8-oxo-dGTP diphosphatase